MELERLTGTVGAVVHGVDLRRVGVAESEGLKAAVMEHLVLVLPDQHLSAAEQVAFTRRLGPPSEVPFIRPTAEEPDAILIARSAQEPPAFDLGGGWHSDFSFMATPPSFTVLQAVDVPSVGGDTVWSSQQAAYESLSPAMRSILDPLVAVHSARRSFAPNMQAGFDALAEATVTTDESAFDEVEHPLVVAHPMTGRRALFVNREYTVGLAGLAPQESAPILEFLLTHSTRQEFTCRWRWSNGDLVIWDNRALAHMVTPDYSGHARRMLRTTVRGAAPLAAEAIGGIR